MTQKLTRRKFNSARKRRSPTSRAGQQTRKNVNGSGIALCHNGICKPQEIRLYHYNEIPDFLKGNPWVVNGYRAFLPFGLCLKSAFMWNNETLNIWTHFLGFVLFVLLMIYDNFIAIPQLKGDLIDHVVISLNLISNQLCMICSTCFHTFCCHSERASQQWLQVDLVGVAMGIIGCHITGVYYGFYCLSMWRDTYMILCAILTTSILCFQLHPHFATKQWFIVRTAAYVSFVLYGIIPALHWIYLHNGFFSPISKFFLPRVAAMYLIEGFAFTFYVSKIPERFFPGAFDYIGSSHQCWHVILVLAMLWWRTAVFHFAQYRLESNTCSDLLLDG